jgi:hypothetical protein
MGTFDDLADQTLAAIPDTVNGINDAIDAINILSAELDGFATSAEADSIAAAASASIAALAIAGITTTSATEIAMARGAKALTVATGLNLALGMTVKLARTADATYWLLGEVTAYDNGTGALTVAVHTLSKSGTYSGWTLSPATAQQGSEDWVTYTANYTVPAGRVAYIDADTSGGAWSLFLPPDPEDNDSVWVHDLKGTWASSPLSVLRNGHTIVLVADDFLCDRNNMTFRFRYKAGDWRVM